MGPFAGRVDPSWNADTQQLVDRANESWLALEDMFRALIREKQQRPADDLLQMRLVDSASEGTISDQELIGLSVFFLAAGHGTASYTLANGLYLLMKHPAQAQKLVEAQRLSEAPELIESAVEEVLRYESPIPMASRLAQADLTLSGAAVRAGDSWAILHLAGVNPGPQRCSSRPRRSMSPARTIATSRSGGVRTSASAPRWPGSRRPWFSRSWARCSRSSSSTARS